MKVGKRKMIPATIFERNDGPRFAGKDEEMPRKKFTGEDYIKQMGCTRCEGNLREGSRRHRASAVWSWSNLSLRAAKGADVRAVN